MALTRRVYADWDKNGVYTEISAYVISVAITIGRTDDRTRVANVGTCTIEVANADLRFTPNYSGGPYYGYLLPNVPIRVTISNGTTTWTLFQGTLVSIEPMAGQYESKRAVLVAQDAMGFLQDTDIALPLFGEETAGPVLRKVTSEAYQTAYATGTITSKGEPVAGDTVTIDGVTYTMAAVPSAAYEFNDNALWFPYGWESNLAAAINAGAGEGTAYGTGTVRHPRVVAYAVDGIGFDPTTISVPIGYTNKRVAGSIPAHTRSVSSVWLRIRKVGSPTNAVLEVVTRDPATGNPTTTLVHANATKTVTAAMVSGSFALVEFTFAGAFDLPNAPCFLSLRSTNGASDASNYFEWSTSSGAGGGWRYLQDYASAWGWAFDVMNYWFPGTVTVEGIARGAWGNALALSTTSSVLTLSGATLAGGVDGPVGKIDYDTGQRLFEYVGDNWVSGETTALDAVRDVVESEFGLFWVARNGTLVFRDNQYQFELTNLAAALTSNNQHSAQTGILTKEAMINRAVMRYRPRSLSAEQVVAKSSKVISVPGNGAMLASNFRWRLSQGFIGAAGVRTITLPYTDLETGQAAGATDLLPLDPGTDYTVTDRESSGGFDYTNHGYVYFSTALSGSGVQMRMENTALGTLYIHNLQQRGKVLQHAEETQVQAEDTASQAAYGIKPYTYSLPYPSSGVDDFARLLADFFISRYVTPSYRVTSVGFRGTETVNGIWVMSLDLGNAIAISEAQTAISAQKFMIIGADYQLPESDVESVTFYLQRLDDIPYWLLGVTGYGELGVKTRLAL